MSVSQERSNKVGQSPPLMPPLKVPKRGRDGYALLQSWTSALEALRANKLRSLLTALGIIIGVAAVIMMIAISESSASVINGRLSSLNPNLLTIRSGSATTSGVRQGAGTQQTLTEADANAIATQVANISAVSPVLTSNGQVVFQGQNWSTSVQGVYASYQQIGSWTVQEGSFFSDSEEQAGASVAVIGQTVADNLFTPQGIDPVGQQIRIGNVTFTVVGVLASKGSSGLGNSDDIVYVPFKTVETRLTGSQRALAISVLVSGNNNMTAAQNAVQEMLQERHGTTDFTIQNQSQILETAQTATQALTILLIGVAAISLLVGGIGIMNIMLVSVTERTREIGIRVALGAYPRDVMLQFLIEALTLSALGGLVGIIIGIVGGYIVSLFLAEPFVLNIGAVLIAFIFSAAVGIVFGFYPARRAARLDPIVALRTE
ncbi:ABC transporter permease [Ktedonospora formicarum]|uniref:ABC transporter permease n=1 Tax=Ktedonospora formicarum TaxID=2778364 RepID=A0A8J3I511_9CHLR|nr:ABC transporter permease [Ktedonospora formicarum]GHO46282.1 ABC transporter permease [Ktedonospora formicarum]